MLSKEKLIAKADMFLQRKQEKDLKQLLSHLDFHIVAQVIDGLHRGKRKTFAALPPELQAQVSMALSEDSKRQVFPRLADDTIARFLHFCAEDDATDILQYLSQSRRSLILLKMQTDKRQKIEKLLKFGSETAGGLMDLNFILVKPELKHREVMERIQRHVETQKQIPTVLLTDDVGNVSGFIPHRHLMFLSPDRPVGDISQSMPLVSHRMDREKVLQVMMRMRSDVIAVLDEHEKVLGVVHLKDLLTVAQAEATEDIYAFAGVDVEEHALDSVFSKVRRRYNWLIVNLATAFLAAFVVSRFEDTIARFAILAVYMPIVAGQGGNAATQALAVVVRGMALGEIGWSKAKKVIIREALAGTVNGVITGSIAAVGAIAFRAPPMLGLVLTLAMIINLLVAGLFGALIPFILKRFNVDPATASTIFVTTATDVFGFLAFLGLGSLLLT